MKTDLSLNHLPPQAPEIEQALLSRCLLDHAEEVVDLIGSNHFYSTAHQKIFSAIVDLHWRKVPTDLLAVTQALSDNGQLESVGGAAYLAGLVDSVPMAVSVEPYARILRDKETKRELLKIAHQTAQACYEDQTDAEDILNDAQRAVLRVDYDQGKPTISTVADLAVKAHDRYEFLAKSGGRITGIPTGYTALDSLTCGLQPSDLIILAARPSMGKTALALNISRKVAHSGQGVLFFSLEMSKDQLFNRLISAEAGVNGMKFKSARFTKDDWEKVVAAESAVYDWPVYIDDSASLSYMEVVRRARRVKKKHDIQLIVIDYLQYVTGDKGQNKNNEIESITRGLKGLAKDLNVPVMLLSQLNRSCEFRSHPHKRPLLSDLRDSGAIEQDADLVWFLYRPERYGELNKHGNEQPGIAEVNVAKHRNGPLGMFRLKWRERITRFDNQ